MTKNDCSHCGTTKKELRPYGPEGADICFDCMMASPDREAEAKARLGALLEAHERLGCDTLLQAGSQPLPLIPRKGES